MTEEENRLTFYGILKLFQGRTDTNLSLGWKQPYSNYPTQSFVCDDTPCN